MCVCVCVCLILMCARVICDIAEEAVNRALPSKCSPCDIYRRNQSDVFPPPAVSDLAGNLIRPRLVSHYSISFDHRGVETSVTRLEISRNTAEAASSAMR